MTSENGPIKSHAAILIAAENESELKAAQRGTQTEHWERSSLSTRDECVAQALHARTSNVLRVEPKDFFYDHCLLRLTES